MKKWMKALDFKEILLQAEVWLIFAFPRYNHFKMREGPNKISYVYLKWYWIEDFTPES